MNEITTVGVDLAKEVIVVCAADAVGRPVYFKQFSFAGFAVWAANLPPCTFGLEACSSAHYWARFLSDHGHAARLMAAEFVAPFRKSKGAKNDRNDAQAVLTAVRQPDMRFVTVKSVEQQAMLAWHRMRSGYSDERTALINRTRGLLAEFGVWLGRSAAALLRALPRLAEEEQLPARFRPLLRQAHEQLLVLEERITACDREIHAHARQSEAAQSKRAPAANSDSARSPNTATPICAGSSPRERAQPCRPHSAAHPTSARASSTGSSPCTHAWAITKPSSRLPTSTCASSGPSSPKVSTTIRTPGNVTHPSTPSAAAACNRVEPTAQDAKLDR